MKVVQIQAKTICYITTWLFICLGVRPQAQDSISIKWSEHFVMLEGGLKSQIETTNLDRMTPSLSLGIGSFDTENTRGRFLAVRFALGDQQFFQNFSVPVDEPNCLFCSRDTTSQVRSDVFSLDITAGRILPLKTIGNQHRLSIVPSLGYAYRRGSVMYLDDATDRDDFDKNQHGLLTAFDIQYRFLASTRVYMGLSANLFLINVAVNRDEIQTSASSRSTTTSLDLDMFLGNSVYFLFGYRL